MPDLTARAQLEFAKSHLRRVEIAWYDPVDWANLSNYVSELMQQLNDARKASNYGDVEAPELDPEDVAAEVEQFVEAVEALLDKLDELDET